MYEDMYTAKEIAQEYNVSSNVVIRCLRSHGVNIRPRGGSRLKVMLNMVKK